MPGRRSARPAICSAEVDEALCEISETPSETGESQPALDLPLEQLRFQAPHRGQGRQPMMRSAALIYSHNPPPSTSLSHVAA